MMVLIGIAVGLVGFLLYWCIDVIADWRHGITKQLLEDGQRSVALAWLFSAFIASCLAVGAASIVVFVSPEAAGSGVPEVMAYLNGSMLPRGFDMRTLLAKFFSAALAVASGLPVGPEGPMIYLGAMLGSQLSRRIGQRMARLGTIFENLTSNKDARDFTVAGAAAGVAVAFSAPIGGLLFAFEEVAGYFRVSLAWKVFACCLVAAFTSAICDSARRAAIERSELVFGTIDDDWWQPFGVNGEVEQHAIAILPAAALGALCGYAAVLFTRLNLRAYEARRKLFHNAPKIYRAIEPCLFAFCFATMSLSLPAMLPCSHSGCVYANPESEHDPESVLMCPTENRHVRRIVERSMELYTCPKSAIDLNSTTTGTSTAGASSNNATQGMYSELATLSTGMAEEAIRHLLTRGTHLEFSFSSLLIMLVVYFLGAAWIASSSVACGLFVPMIFIGSLLGRSFGLFLTKLCALFGMGSAGAPAGVFLMAKDPAYAWIDPGVFALVGAGGFMGGVTRLTFSLAVIMIEISGETNFLLPILVAIVTAKSVASYLCPRALYDALLHLKRIPFMPEQPELAEPQHRRAFDAYPVTVACSHQDGKPVTVREQIGYLAARRLLASTTHGGFPVVRTTSHGDLFVGFIHREDLESLMQTQQEHENGLGPSNTWHTHTRRDASHQDGVAAEDGVLMSDGRGGGVLGMQDTLLDLTEHIDTSIITLNAHFSIKRAYEVFQNLALRYLVVIDEINRPVGVITRKDLMGPRIERGINEHEGVDFSDGTRSYDPAEFALDL